MRTYLLSLGAGLLVGIVYSLLNVRSPAPPVVALVGLLGILIGEQIMPVARHMLEGSHLAAAWRQSHGTPHIFGLLPGRHEQATQPKIDSEPGEEHMTKPESRADLILHRGLFTTLARSKPTATVYSYPPPSPEPVRSDPHGVLARARRRIDGADRTGPGSRPDAVDPRSRRGSSTNSKRVGTAIRSQRQRSGGRYSGAGMTHGNAPRRYRCEAHAMGWPG